MFNLFRKKNIKNKEIQEFRIIFNKLVDIPDKEKIQKMKDICEGIDDVYTIVIFTDKILLSIKSKSENMLNILQILFNEFAVSVERI